MEVQSKKEKKKKLPLEEEGNAKTQNKKLVNQPNVRRMLAIKEIE